MRQHISIEQLNELSEKGRDRLRKWCIKKNYYEWIDISMPSALVKTPSTIKKKIRPLSIGRMIEFLDEHSHAGHEFWIDIIDEWQWDAEALWNESNNTKHLELCDALWEACKEVLEK